MRRGVDLLAARPDVDAKRLGFVGFSFGADLGGILTGVERRIEAYALEIKWWDGGRQLNDEAMRHRAEWFRSRIGIAAP